MINYLNINIFHYLLLLCHTAQQAKTSLPITVYMEKSAGSLSTLYERHMSPDVQIVIFTDLFNSTCVNYVFQLKELEVS